MAQKQAMVGTIGAGVCLWLSACGGSDTDGLSGEIKVNGSSTVFPISQLVAEEFGAANPGVNITVGSEGTGSGFQKFIAGETAVSNASRSIKPGEHQQLVEENIPYIELPIAYDGLSIIVHKNNTWADQLTVEQLERIFRSEHRGEVSLWSDIDPSWPKQEIKRFIAGTHSGTFDYFKEVIADEGSIRPDVTATENDNEIINGVSGEPHAIGFLGAAYYFASRDKVRAVPIVNRDGVPTQPTPESIESGDYNPFSRPLFIYVRVDALDRPEVSAFVDFYLQDAGEFAEEVGYVALPKLIYDRGKTNVLSRKSGTQYVSSDGEKIQGPVTEVYQ
ncbi:MAG: PstS family phosphate ABC transporter substrate-binding protein [Phycisphaeraceae bacterium]